MDRPLAPLTPAARFAADWRSIWPCPDLTGLAVSGGPDSLGLLLLAHEAIPGAFEVATVDHGLRAESVLEAEAVAATCAALGISCTILRPRVASTGNLQANARLARYTALGEWATDRGLAAIVTAHHADDQAETLLMRLARGAGLRGLAGMRAVAAVPGHPGLPLIRPLLGWRKAELEVVVAQAGLIPARDSSNANLRFERVRVRAALASESWLEPVAIAASATHLGEADTAVDWAAVREWNECVTADGSALHYRPQAPRAIRLRVIERIVATLGHEGTPRGSEIARFDDALSAGRIATLAGVRGESGLQSWHFAPAPPRKVRLPA